MRTDNNMRIGFEFIDLATNDRNVLAYTTGNGPRVGRYFGIPLKGEMRRNKMFREFCQRLTIGLKSHSAISVINSDF